MVCHNRQTAYLIKRWQAQIMRNTLNSTNLVPLWMENTFYKMVLKQKKIHVPVSGQRLKRGLKTL